MYEKFLKRNNKSNECSINIFKNSNFIFVFINIETEKNKSELIYKYCFKFL